MLTVGQKLQQQLDCRRLVTPLNLLQGTRTVLRRGQVELVKLADKRQPKPKRAVRVELILLSDMLLYGTQKAVSPI